jgi:hypothetical protein
VARRPISFYVFCTTERRMTQTTEGGGRTSQSARGHTGRVTQPSLDDGQTPKNHSSLTVILDETKKKEPSSYPTHFSNKVRRQTLPLANSRVSHWTVYSVTTIRAQNLW